MSRDVRVGLVCPYSLSVPGGVQGQVSGLAAALARKGHEVVVVAPRDEPVAEAGHEQRSGDAVRVVGAGRSLRVPANGSRAPVALGLVSTSRALSELRRWQPEVLHVHEPFVPAVALGALGERALLRRYGRHGGEAPPVVATFHRAGSGASYRALRPLARVVLGWIDDAVAVSPAARSTLEEVVGRSLPRVRLVGNGVDVERFAAAARDPWPKEGPTVVFAGRHEQRKGLAVLLEAFSAQSRDARLWVVGSGPQTAALRASYSTDRRISWCGRLSDDDLARRLAGADVYVSPALGGESFGVVLLEAMASGTAVVASDIEGYRLVAGAAACLVPPGEPAPLASALAELLADGNARSQLEEAGRRLVAGCSIDSVAETYLARYQALVT